MHFWLMTPVYIGKYILTIGLENTVLRIIKVKL